MCVYPELVIVTRGALLDEGSVVRSYVPVVGVLLQHVDLQFDLFLLVLHTHTHIQIKSVRKLVRQKDSQTDVRETDR